MRPGQPEGIGPGSGDPDVVALVLEELPQDLPDGIPVIDDEELRHVDCSRATAGERVRSTR